MGAYMTHRFEYEAYAPRWGAQIISMEIGEDVPNTQSKIAIARGASRAAQLPWSAQVSPWHGPSVTTHGPVLFAGGVWQGADAGHSASFYVRLYAHVWFAGAAFLTPENSIAIFYDVQPNSTHAGILSAHGEAARRGRALMRAHDRGTPLVPLAVIIDAYAGYSRSACITASVGTNATVAWGVFTSNAQAAETRGLKESVCPVEILADLFERQLWPYRGDLNDPLTRESVQLRPTPFGELADVLLSDAAPAALLAEYSAVLLAGGDIDFAAGGG
jgi:hypothetical protein